MAGYASSCSRFSGTLEWKISHGAHCGFVWKKRGKGAIVTETYMLLHENPLDIQETAWRRLRAIRLSPIGWSRFICIGAVRIWWSPPGFITADMWIKFSKNRWVWWLDPFSELLEAVFLGKGMNNFNGVDNPNATARKGKKIRSCLELLGRRSRVYRSVPGSSCQSTIFITATITTTFFFFNPQQMSSIVYRSWLWFLKVLGRRGGWTKRIKYIKKFPLSVWAKAAARPVNQGWSSIEKP